MVGSMSLIIRVAIHNIELLYNMGRSSQGALFIMHVKRIKGHFMNSDPYD